MSTPKSSGGMRYRPIQTTEPKQIQPKELTLIFLMESLAPDFADSLRTRLAASGAQEILVSDDFFAAEDGTLHANIRFDGHQLRLIGFNMPPPKQAIERAMECAHWSKSDKQAMWAHKAHMVCQYNSGTADLGQQMLAINRLAGCFLESGLLGLVDPDAWNCMPAHVLRNVVLSSNGDDFVADPPLVVWAGFAKLFKSKNEVWFCSKAYHRWGVPDFAWLGNLGQAGETFELFQALFDYVRKSKVVLKVGDTAQFGEDLILRFGAIYEYQEYLEGPLGTLVIERLDPANFH